MTLESLTSSRGCAFFPEPGEPEEGPGGISVPEGLLQDGVHLSNIYGYVYYGDDCDYYDYDYGYSEYDYDYYDYDSYVYCYGE